jgi:hypothetical protein
MSGDMIGCQAELVAAVGRTTTSILWPLIAVVCYTAVRMMLFCSWWDVPTSAVQKELFYGLWDVPTTQNM